jgi:hypothetical protein
MGKQELIDQLFQQNGVTLYNFEDSPSKTLVAFIDNEDMELIIIPVEDVTEATTGNSEVDGNYTIIHTTNGYSHNTIGHIAIIEQNTIS